MSYTAFSILSIIIIHKTHRLDGVSNKPRESDDYVYIFVYV